MYSSVYETSANNSNDQIDRPTRGEKKIFANPLPLFSISTTNIEYSRVVSREERESSFSSFASSRT